MSKTDQKALLNLESVLNRVYAERDNAREQLADHRLAVEALSQENIRISEENDRLRHTLAVTNVLLDNEKELVKKMEELIAIKDNILMAYRVRSLELLLSQRDFMLALIGEAPAAEGCKNV